MSAPQIMIFLPAGRSYTQLLHELSSTLLLSIDVIPPDFPFAFSAQRLDTEYILIEYNDDAREMIDEMQQWNNPSQEYKSILQDCGSCINMHYRNIDLAKKGLDIIGNHLGQLSPRSIVENGYGCLLRLSEINKHCSHDSMWSWEREAFPDIPEVASSEWSD